jgi:Mg-chelatase subunit ChlD
MSVSRFLDTNVIFEQNKYNTQILNNIGSRIEITQKLRHPDNTILTVEETKNFMEQNRNKTSICVLLDNSGSMHGNPLENSKKVIKYFVQNVLGSKDYFSLITFNSEAVVVINKMMIEDNIEYILTQISLIEAGSCTNIPDAISTGLTLMNDDLEGYTKNILLFTDGVNTVGPRDCAEIMSNLNSINPDWSKTSINCCGLGKDVDLETLNMISKESESKIMVIEKTSDIIPDFVDMFLNLIHQNDKEILIRFEHKTKIPENLINSELKEVYSSDTVQKFKIPKTIIGEPFKFNVCFEFLQPEYFSDLRVEFEIHDTKHKYSEIVPIIYEPNFEDGDDIEFNHDITIDLLENEYQKIMKIYNQSLDTSLLQKFSQKCKKSGIPVDNPRLKELLEILNKFDEPMDDYERGRLTLYSSPYVLASNLSQNGGGQNLDSPLRTLSSQLASQII